MIPRSLAQLIEADRLDAFQKAIVATLKTLITGVAVTAHPGKADVAELIGKTVATAPGIAVGWSRMRWEPYPEGGYGLKVDWVAYIVVEAKEIANKRVEATTVAFAIGARILDILGDTIAPHWGIRGVLPPENSPPAELKPIFTVKDAKTGTTYYAVTWTQGIAALGEDHFPDVVAQADPENGTINFESEAAIDKVKRFFAGLEVNDGEE